MEATPGKRSLTEWGFLKVPQLKSFLWERKWWTTGNKEELVALCYAAEQMDIPIAPTALEERKAKELEYSKLLYVGGVQLPDPFQLKDWQLNAKDKWPATMMIDITQYLLKPEHVALGRRLLGEYKEGKAYSYMQSNFIEMPSYHSISTTSTFCFLKSRSLPSQCHSQTAHNLWVLAE